MDLLYIVIVSLISSGAFTRLVFHFLNKKIEFSIKHQVDKELETHKKGLERKLENYKSKLDKELETHKKGLEHTAGRRA